MEVGATPQPDVVQQQQIQALLANVGKLTHQNEELRKTMESQNTERWRMGETKMKKSQTLKPISETELQEKIPLEMDKLKSAMKDKGGENLDGMIWRTDSPFTNIVLNYPLLPKFHLPQLESYDGTKDPLDHIESFKTLMQL